MSDEYDMAMDAEQDRREAEEEEKRRQRALVEPKAANCGECLMEHVEIVPLVGGVCPKCGADYRAKPTYTCACDGVDEPDVDWCPRCTS